MWCKTTVAPAHLRQVVVAAQQVGQRGHNGLGDKGQKVLGVGQRRQHVENGRVAQPLQLRRTLSGRGEGGGRR